MTYEQFMNTPFKIGGDGEEWLLKDELPHVNRHVKRWIKSELAHGREPFYEDILSMIRGEE